MRGDRFLELDRECERERDLDRPSDFERVLDRGDLERDLDDERDRTRYPRGILLRDESSCPSSFSIITAVDSLQ